MKDIIDVLRDLGGSSFSPLVKEFWIPRYPQLLSSLPSTS